MPMMLINKPPPPTPRISSGFFRCSGSTIRFIASMKIEKHNATRKTAFTSAPRTSALTHPNVLASMLLGFSFFENYKETYTRVPESHLP